MWVAELDDSLTSSPPKKKRFFSEEEISLLRQDPIPHHVAIIMDGNRRWSQKKIKQQSLAFLKGLPLIPKKELNHGHYAGATNVLDVVRSANELGIKVMTLYAFSTENWKRSSYEIETLLGIFEQFLINNQSTMQQEGVRFRAIGDLLPFPTHLQKQIEITEKATENGEAIDLVVAFNYGGRDEICRAFKKMSIDMNLGFLQPEEITPEKVSCYLDTAHWKDPDLLIRTSGEMRLSNFLLWQLAYTEIYVTPVLWPDFTPRELAHAVRDYQLRERRGGT